MAFYDYVNELKGYVPGLSPFLSQKFVNRAWQDIRDADEWSFLEGRAIIQIPPLVTTGTISYTQFGNTIVGDAAASAAWAAITTGPANPPFVASTNAAGQPLIGTGYQIRITAGPLYSIIGTDDGFPITTLTVDGIISEPTYTGPYQAYRQYLGAPSTDFLVWTSITNFAQGYPIVGRRLTGSQAQLNYIDPQRMSQEDFYFLFTLYADANGMPIKEMWPGPINQQGYIGMYRRRGTDLSPAQDLPASLPAECLMERARMYAYMWKSTQRREPGDETDWTRAAQLSRQQYDGPEPQGNGLLAAAKKKDTSLRTPAPIIRRGPGVYPWSGQFCAAHDTARMANVWNGFLGGI